MIAAVRPLVTLGLLALAVSPARAAGNVVQAEQFVLRDSEGNVVGAFSVGEGGRPGLVLYDRDGVVRVVLDLRPDGSPALILTDKDGRQRVHLGMVKELLSALRAQEGAPEPRALPMQVAGGEPREAVATRLPYGAAILGVALLAVTALVLLGALIVLDRRSLRSSRQFHELWASVMHDRDRERAAFRDALLAQRNAASVQRESLQCWEDVGADMARSLERVRGEIDEQLGRLRRN
ncbi:MAG: hypothetical protein ACREM3_04335 [Candidatus Rokuibacteriota bacterium]